MTWREIKCVDKMDVQQRRRRDGAETESFRQIDGDEGGLQMTPILITTHNCSDGERKKRGCVWFCGRLFFLIYSWLPWCKSSCGGKKVALTSGGIRTILKHNIDLFGLDELKHQFQPLPLNSGPGLWLFLSQTAFVRR